MSGANCALCGVSTQNSDGPSEGRSFCCPGCRAVFDILERRGEVAQGRDHPLFKRALESGILSNRTLLEELAEKNSPDGERAKLFLEIEGLWCTSCSQLISWTLEREMGIVRSRVDYATDLAAIEYLPHKISAHSILEKISALGYRPHELSGDRGWEGDERRRMRRRVGISLFCALNVMMLSYPLYAIDFDGEDVGFRALFGYLSMLFALPILLYGAWPLFQRAYHGIRRGFLGMEFLATAAAVAAALLSCYRALRGEPHLYFDAMSMLITLTLVGKYLEQRAKFSAKGTMVRLMRGIAKKGRKRLEDGTEQLLPLKEIAIGDLLICRMGEAIAADGEVIEGEGYCDEAVMTGESLPLFKEKKSKVVSGALLQRGELLYRVDRDPAHSSLQQILHTVEKQIATKGGEEEFVDPLIAWAIPFILFTALTVGIGLLLAGKGEESLARALSILLISCPCAIGIAKPLAEARLIDALASIGVLLNNRAILPQLGETTHFVFDKTGTATEGVFQLESGLETLSGEERSLLKAMALRSTHPLALALAQAIDLPPTPLETCEELPALGMRAAFKKRRYLLGSELLLAQHGIIGLPDPSESSPLLFACDHALLATLQLRDTIRPMIPPLLRALEPRPSLLLSGDSLSATERVAQRCGFHSWKGRTSPIEKCAVIRALKESGAKVWMIGDGVNDAPALAEATLSLSVANACALSIQISDLLLTGHHLERLPQIEKLGRTCRKIARQNLLWSSIYNLFGIGLAIAGLLTPLFASFAMAASSLFVLANSRRIHRAYATTNGTIFLEKKEEAWQSEKASKKIEEAVY